MKLIRRGQHKDRLPIETSPAPPDITSPVTRIPALLQDPATARLPFTQTDLTALTPPPRRRALPPPGPSSLPALQPPPRPRPAWAPPQPPTRVRITEPAALACPGGRIPAALTLPCGSCHRVHVRGATSSFTALYTTAAQDGWRRDLFGVMACPACQAHPGWRAPHPPVLRRGAEHALIADVTAARAPRWRWRQALRNPRIWLDTRALRALRS